MPYRTPTTPYTLENLDMVDRLSLLPTFVDLTGECPICADYALHGATRGVRGHHPMCPTVRHQSSLGSARSSSSGS